MTNELTNLSIDNTPEEERKIPPLIERILGSTYVNNLIPPIEACFWGHETINVLNNQKLISPGTDWIAPTLWETLTWTIDAYKYVVTARPDDPNFQGDGGAIYIVLVHGGSAQTGAVRGSSIEYRCNVTPWSGSLTPVKQLPASNSGTKNGDNWSYPFSFKQTMPMFKNNGNATFDFNAEYIDQVDMPKGKQTGVVMHDGVQFGATFDADIDFYLNFPFAAVSVFKLDKPGKASFKCKAGAYVLDWNPQCQASAEKIITIDCNF